MGKGGTTLKDLQKGSQNFGDGKWIAFRNNRMECMLQFSKPVRARSITVSTLVNVGAMIFPPRNIRIMGGNDPSNLRLLYQLAPPSDTLLTSNYLIPYECKFPPVSVRYIRVMVEPFGRLPVSMRPPLLPSPKKNEKPKPFNDKGWFFIDELFVN
jgi:hypothetical protein